MLIKSRELFSTEIYRAIQQFSVQRKILHSAEKLESHISEFVLLYGLSPIEDPEYILNFQKPHERQLGMRLSRYVAFKRDDGILNESEVGISFRDDLNGVSAF